MIFSVNGNTISAYGVIYGGNGMEFVSLLTNIEAKFAKITLKLHTYGGSVFDGNLMFNAIQNSKADIEIHIVGIAASMGAVLSLSRKNNVYMVENGYMMIHAPLGYTDGTALDHENNAKLLRAIETNFVKKLIERTGKTTAYVEKWLTGDNWFDADEALKEGLITGIISPETETQTETFVPEQIGTLETYNRFSALLIPKNEPPTNSEITMKKPIIEALALVGVSEQSSDTAVIEAVKAHFNEQINALKQKVTTAEAAQKTVEEKLTAQSKTAVDAAIADAKKAGKITDKDVPTYEGIATASGIETLNTILAAIPARKSITSQVAGTEKTTAGAPVGREDWDFDKWQKEDPQGFEALAKAEPETFQELLTKKYPK